MDDYEYTGNDVPVRMNDVIESVLNILNQYDDSIKNGIVPDTDPFREQIVLPNKNGKYFAVPEEVQRKAIQIWLSNKEGNISESKEENENIEGFENNNSSIMKYILTIIVIAVIIWLSMKYMH
jgi:hypothetical protein